MNEIEVIAELLLGENKQVIRYEEIQRYELNASNEIKTMFILNKDREHYDYNVEYVVHMRLYTGKLKTGKVFLEIYPNNFVSGHITSHHVRYNSVQILNIFTLLNDEQILDAEKNGKGAR